MKHIAKTNTSGLIALSVLSIFLFSFLPKSGGEGFEVYLNNKVVLQQFGKDLNAIKSVSLDQSNSNDELMIKYHRCGNGAQNRLFTIKDAQNRILKQWHFTNNTGSIAMMSCKVKEILSLQKGNGHKFNLYYSSSEIPEGRLLTVLLTGTGTTAAR